MSRCIVASSLGAGGVVALALGALGCTSLDQQECDDLRSQAFEIVNEAHPCNTDEDCVGTGWPGCMKPVSSKNHERIKPIEEKFKKGKCKEPDRDCRNPPEVYCKQGLCVVRERPPEG
ncbi:MAG: hypothetical protein JRI23_30360 [Deltaproteobacteria bacterium]|jgi:hypothetical protein|nr:hypothetical protein [Deltaproteobacteria bacterium]MBW2536477.1 hypothetical protein [Deltaproteobacteria bacterium]